MTNISRPISRRHAVAAMGVAGAASLMPGGGALASMAGEEAAAAHDRR